VLFTGRHLQELKNVHSTIIIQTWDHVGRNFFLPTKT